MVQLDKDLLTWLKEKFYTITDIDSLLSNKSDKNHTHTADGSLSTESMNPVANKVITNELNNKAGKNHASTTTDYGEATNTKYGHVKVDTELNTTSTSPVQNKVIKNALENKAPSVHNHNSLSSTIISSNQDLNNYKTVGEYYCSTNTVAATLSNCPVTIAFHLSIIQHAGIRQIIKTYATNNVRTYERNFYNNAWSPWYLTYTSETLTTDNGLMSSNEKTKLSRIADDATKNIVDTSLNTSSNNAIANKAVATGLNGKAPTNHASYGTSYPYGLGSTTNYGHCKTINGLTQSSHSDGTALSAYQGKILKDLIDTKSPNGHTHTGSELRLGSSGTDANVTIQTAVNNKLDSTHNDVKAATNAYGHTKLSSSTSSSDETLAATAKAVKTTYDFAATKPNLGTTESTAAKGNHTHGYLTNDGKIGTAQYKPLITGPNGVVTVGSFGSTENTFCQGNDTRLNTLATPTVYGRVKIINHLNSTGWAEGESLSAYQGNVLKGYIDNNRQYYIKIGNSSATTYNDPFNFTVPRGSSFYINVKDGYGNNATGKVYIELNNTLSSRTLSNSQASLAISSSFPTGDHVVKVFYIDTSTGKFLASAAFKITVT